MNYVNSPDEQAQEISPTNFTLYILIHIMLWPSQKLSAFYVPTNYAMYRSSIDGGVLIAIHEGSDGSRLRIQGAP